MPRQIVFTGHVLVSSGAKAAREDAEIAIAQCLENDVTGMTLMCDGSFITAVEGPDETVEQILTFYQIDPRLGQVKALLDVKRDAREFSDYTIGFRKGDFMEGLDNAFRITMGGLHDHMETVENGEAKILLNTFSRVNSLAA